jgi:quercetin dioxygenase-like cupin family protein
MSTDFEPKLIAPGEGRTVQLFGVRFDYKVESSASGGSLAVLEVEIPAKTLVKPHTHSREDEFSLVQAGSVGVRIGDRVLEAGPGAWLVKPRGTPHAMWNASSTTARVVEILSPGGLEKYFEELGPILAHEGGAGAKEYTGSPSQSCSRLPPVPSPLPSLSVRLSGPGLTAYQGATRAVAGFSIGLAPRSAPRSPVGGSPLHGYQGPPPTAAHRGALRLHPAVPPPRAPAAGAWPWFSPAVDPPHTQEAREMTDIATTVDQAFRVAPDWPKPFHRNWTL